MSQVNLMTMIDTIIAKRQLASWRVDNPLVHLDQKNATVSYNIKKQAISTLPFILESPLNPHSISFTSLSVLSGHRVVSHPNTLAHYLGIITCIIWRERVGHCCFLVRPYVLWCVFIVDFLSPTDFTYMNQNVQVFRVNLRCNYVRISLLCLFVLPVWWSSLDILCKYIKLCLVDSSLSFL